MAQVAARAGCDAVWPGWGHASENPELPATLQEHGIRFLGPGSVAMAALGDKIGSTILAQAAGVPTLAWSGTGVSVGFTECGGTIPDEVYQKACIHRCVTKQGDGAACIHRCVAKEGDGAACIHGCNVFAWKVGKLYAQ
eukprot:364557-Chlamydomonas_euryale.AAC.44